MRVGVGADHRASVGVELEVCPAAAADLEQAKCAVAAGKFAHFSEKVSLRFMHLVVV